MAFRGQKDVTHQHGRDRQLPEPRVQPEPEQAPAPDSPRIGPTGTLWLFEDQILRQAASTGDLAARLRKIPTPPDESSSASSRSDDQHNIPVGPRRKRPKVPDRIRHEVGEVRGAKPTPGNPDGSNVNRASSDSNRRGSQERRGSKSPPTANVPPFNTFRHPPEGAQGEEDRDSDEEPPPPPRHGSSLDSLPKDSRPRAPRKTSTTRQHLSTVLGEIIGTTMFLFLAFAATETATSGALGITTAIAGNPNIQQLLFISLAFSVSLTINAWIFFRVTGGFFNPAVTLALWLTGALRPTAAILVFFAQIAGSIAASALTLALFSSPASVRTTLSPGTSIVRGLFIETILSAELVFAALMLAKDRDRATPMASIGIGVALFVGEMAGLPYTGGSMNPARSLGPNVVANMWEWTHWIYWAGPIIGSLLATTLYCLIRGLHGELAYPTREGDRYDGSRRHPTFEIRRSQRVNSDSPSSTHSSYGVDPFVGRSTPGEYQEQLWRPGRSPYTSRVYDNPSFEEAGVEFIEPVESADQRGPLRVRSGTRTQLSMRRTVSGSDWV
jgi:MIP family channel proteins